MLYGHGDDFYNAKNEVKINFSSNVWHGANLDKLKEHLIEHFVSASLARCEIHDRYSFFL